MLSALFSGDIKSWIVSMLLSVPGILVAISFHEWAHAFVAFKLGDPTARNVGRLTLDPISHIDPVGAIMLLLMGFGWAKPVPVNPRNFSKPKRDDVLVSLAGITTNMLLAFVFSGIYILLFSLGVTNEIVLGIVGGVISINIGLGVFNLIPIPPLDGWHLLRNALIGHVKPQTLWNIERYSGTLILVLFVGMRFLGWNFISQLMRIISGAFINFWVLFL